MSTLTAGSTYVLVTTSFANSDFGAYGVNITVPEPATFALLVLGLGGLGGRRCLRRVEDNPARDGTRRQARATAPDLSSTGRDPAA